MKKKYITPQVTIELFKAEDVIMGLEMSDMPSIEDNNRITPVDSGE